MSDFCDTKKRLCKVSQQNVLFKLSFNSILVFYMYRTSYVHLQEDYLIHAALYGMFSMLLRQQSTRLKDLFEHILQPGGLLT